jgi:hypothetical protein
MEARLTTRLAIVGLMLLAGDVMTGCNAGYLTRANEASATQPAHPRTLVAKPDELRGDYERLVDDIPRAISKAHWGLQWMTPAAWPKGDDGKLQLIPINASALLPDGREAFLRAEPAGEDRIALTVAVGRTGDPREEKAFATVLQKVLDGKPKPKRGGTFELPKLSTTQPAR